MAKKKTAKKKTANKKTANKKPASTGSKVENRKMYLGVVTSNGQAEKYPLDSKDLHSLLAGDIPSIEVPTRTSPGVRFVSLVNVQ